MKNVFSKTMLAVVGAALMMLPLSAGAQTPILRFGVPFAFTAGSQVLAPGQYLLNLDTDQMRFLISSRTGPDFSVVRYVPGGVTRPAAKADHAMLRFQKIGGRYFLIGVWQPGYVHGHSIVPSRHLLEAAKAAAGREFAASYINLP